MTKTSYNTAKVPSLVDSGATDNFIHPWTVRQLRLGMFLLDQPKRLFNVDDTQNKAGSVTQYVNLNVITNQEERQMQFLVSDIGRESLILGYPWLAAFKPCFKWKKGTLNPQYLPITCQSVKPVQQQEDQQEKRAIVAQLEEDCTNRSIATDLAIQAKFEPLEVELPDVYKRYASMFSEEEVQRFLPSCPWNCYDTSAGPLCTWQGRVRLRRGSPSMGSCNGTWRRSRGWRNARWVWLAD